MDYNILCEGKCYFYCFYNTVLDKNNQGEEAFILVPGFRRVSPWLLGCIQTWADMAMRGHCSGHTPRAGTRLGVVLAGEGQRGGKEEGVRKRIP